MDANRALGLPDDCREYTSVRNILADLGVASIRLMTNNPRKIGLLTSLGIKISGRIPCQVRPGWVACCLGRSVCRCSAVLWSRWHVVSYLAPVLPTFSPVPSPKVAAYKLTWGTQHHCGRIHTRCHLLTSTPHSTPRHPLQPPPPHPLTCLLPPFPPHPQVAAGKFNKGYLEAKRERMDHLLDGSWCYWNHDGEPVAFSKGGMGLPEQGFKMPDGQLIMPTGGSRFSSGGSSSAVEASVAQEQQAGQGQQQQGKQQQGKQQQGKQQEQQQQRAELQ